MSKDINSVVIVGRVTRDAELRYTPNGTAICSFSVAVNRRVKRGESWEDVASFFELYLWDKLAESLNKYLLKGSQVAVQGELRQERWEKDGQKHSKVKIFVSSIQLVGGKRDGSSGTSPGGRETPPDEDFDPTAYEDDIPF